MTKRERNEQTSERIDDLGKTHQKGSSMEARSGIRGANIRYPDASCHRLGSYQPRRPGLEASHGPQTQSTPHHMPESGSLHSLILSSKGVFCPLVMHTPSCKSRNETSLAPSIYTSGGVLGVQLCGGGPGVTHGMCRILRALSAKAERQPSWELIPTTHFSLKESPCP